MKKEIRSLAEMPTISNDGKTLEGYALKYDTQSCDLGGFREIIRKGAFDRCLAGNPDVRILVDHDPAKIMGRTKSGTAKVWGDDIGIKYQCGFSEASYAKDLKLSMERGDIDASSFAFSIAAGGDKFSRDGNTIIREVTDADLFDCSPVTFPAYDSSTASLRSQEFIKAEEAKVVDIAAAAKEIATSEEIETTLWLQKAKQKQMEVEITL